MKIETEAEYEAALAHLAKLMGAEPNTPESKELNELADALVLYEKKHFPFPEERE
jgi:antitoxin component HigA of HigAB toxin-antitoxin module